MIKGAGGGSKYDQSWKFNFIIFSKRGEEDLPEYQMLFTSSLNIDPDQSNGSKVKKMGNMITGDPKGPSSGSTFWSGFEAPDS